MVFLSSILFGLGLLALFIAIGGFLHPNQHPGPGIFLLCLLPFAFMLISSLIGSFGFRRFGRPLADFMSAIDAVGRGDLSVQVSEHGPGQIRRMAHSFNHMVSELARAEKQRRNMTADIAHELRTPLHIIQGNLEGMLDGIYEPNPENLNATLEETRLLARLVADLQTLSLAEAGQLPLHPTRFRIGDLLEDITASFAMAANENDIEIVLDLSPSTHTIEINADYDRLDQVFSNLMTNALRHTPDGGKITLSAASQGPQIQIRVADTGPGIAPADLPYIFDRFWKADRARTRSARSGSGLGLAITRQLVLAHQGSISVESHPGAGATFIIELPLAAVTASNDPAEKP